MGQLGDNGDIVAIFADTHDDAIELAIPNQGVEGAHQLSAVRLPSSAEGILLGPWGAAVVHAEHLGRAIGFEMCTGRTRHEPESSDVCEL
jgi:hypothetical protein